MYVNDKNMLYHFYCVTVFQLKLDHTQIEIEYNYNGVAFSQILRGGFFYLKKNSWQSSLGKLLQKVFQFVLVPVGAFLIDFGSFV